MLYDQQALVANQTPLGQLSHHLLQPRVVVGRIGEDEIVLTFQLVQGCLNSPPAHPRAVGQGQIIQVLPQLPSQPRARLDEVDPRGPSTQCLDSHGAGAGVQVQHAGAFDRVGADDGEYRSADPRGGRP